MLKSFRSFFKRSGPLGVLAVLFVASLLWLTLMRGVLVALYWQRLQDVEQLWWLFPVGVRMDTLLVCQLYIVPMMIYLLAPGKVWRERAVAILLTVCTAMLLHMELSTPNFIAQYDNRPDRIYFEYLRYPREVLGTLLKSYPLQLLLVVVLVASLTYAFWRWVRSAMAATDEWPWPKRAIAFPIMLILMFMGARSSLGHRPANMSTAAYSNNHLVNELAVNSTYSLMNAIRTSFAEVSAAKMYGDQPWPDTLARVRRYMQQSNDAFNDAEILTLHKQAPTQTSSATRPPNLVIFGLESLGAGFVGGLGGLPLTPNMDRLSNEGLWFTHLYATGTRTVRGMEALITGFPPTASPSVLKLPASQRNFFTLGQLLKQHGYATEFIYGGVSNFDNMGKFFRENGFDRVIEQKDFENPTLLGTWGVSDEDLVNKANETFIAHGDQPFFAFLMSTSNHEPFEFPEGRIELHEQPAATRNNAVKYTDYAVGKLIELAKQSAYFKNTIFLVVADHDARVFGADLVPVDRFHVPALIIGPSVPQRHEDRVASQIDLAPTLLGLMGINTTHPMIGRNVLNLPADDPGRAIMQYADVNAFRVGNKVAIHQPHLPAKTFNYIDGHLELADNDEELQRDALAHLLWADKSYREQRYRLPSAPPQLTR